MLIGGVVHDKIENDVNAAFFSRSGKRVEIGQGPVHRVDIFVVGNVIAEIDLWRREARGNPDRIHAQIL